MTIGLIVAMDPHGVIGLDGQIPWRYPSDVRRFKALTMGGTLIMGRKTFESMGRRHLPGRTSLVLSSVPQPDVLTFGTLAGAIAYAWTEHRGQTVWILGGAQVYRDVLEHGFADFADVTLVPPVTLPAGAHEVTSFPIGLLSEFTLVSTTASPNEPLEHRRYERSL